MTLFPKQNVFVLFFFIGQSLRYSVDSVRSVLWSAFEKYCGQSPIRTLVSLQEVLWTISDTYFGQSLRSTVDSRRKSFAFLMYHRTPNTGSIISMHSHPCHVIPVHKCNASVIACHFMLHVRYVLHATYKSHITYQVSWINYV